MNRKVCFIAQFPPPMHGLSKAVETLYNSELAGIFNFEKINLTDNRKIISNLWKINHSRAELFYFTISQTRAGNLRDLAILKLMWIRHKKCIVHLHGGYYRQLVDNGMPKWQKRANYKAIGRLEGVIVLGKSLMGMFEGMIASDKIHIVPNCVDDEFLMSDEKFNEKLRMIGDRTIKHILYLSNFIRSKGYPEVLEIAKLEKDRCESGGNRKFHFDFAGKFFGKTDKDFFFQFIKKNGLEEYVTYHGIVSGYEKKKLLEESDMMALLSRYPNEGQPISILEAMGNGSVIITTDHAGIPDIVSAGNGILADSHTTVKRIYSILDSLESTDIREMEVRGRETVMKGYTQNRYINNMKVLLRGECHEESTFPD